MAVWPGPVTPFIFDYSAPWLPMIQGPAAWFAGMSQARRQSQDAENRAKSQASFVDAQNWGNFGRSIGASLSPAISTGIMSQTSAGMEALNANNGALRNAFAASALVGSGAPVANYLGDQASAGLARENAYFHDTGMTPEQATQMGRAAYESAPPPIQLEMLGAAGIQTPDAFGSMSDDQRTTFYRNVATQYVPRQQEIASRIQTVAGIEAARQTMDLAGQRMQGLSAGALQLTDPYAKEYDQREAIYREQIASGNYTPQQVAQLGRNHSSDQLQYLASLPPKAFQPVIRDPQQEFDKITVTDRASGKRGTLNPRTREFQPFETETPLPKNAQEFQQWAGTATGKIMMDDGTQVLIGMDPDKKKPIKLAETKPEKSASGAGGAAKASKGVGGIGELDLKTFQGFALDLLKAGKKTSEPIAITGTDGKQSTGYFEKTEPYTMQEIADLYKTMVGSYKEIASISDVDSTERGVAAEQRGFSIKQAKTIRELVNTTPPQLWQAMGVDPNVLMRGAERMAKEALDRKSEGPTAPPATTRPAATSLMRNGRPIPQAELKDGEVYEAPDGRIIRWSAESQDFEVVE